MLSAVAGVGAGAAGIANVSVGVRAGVYGNARLFFYVAVAGIWCWVGVSVGVGVGGSSVVDVFVNCTCCQVQFFGVSTKPFMAHTYTQNRARQQYAAVMFHFVKNNTNDVHVASSADGSCWRQLLTAVADGSSCRCWWCRVSFRLLG